MPLTPATRIGTYEILAPLGAGGMGEVYRARDLRLGREIALKVLPHPMASDAERLARFEREARTVAGLNHPNIVVLHSIEDEDDVRFITMELVQGQTLGQLMDTAGLPLARVIDLGMAIAEALAAAHAMGVIHRDLKPANVMVTAEGRVKVLDFGLAKLEASAEPTPESGIASLLNSQTPTATAPLSIAGAMIGTVPYMAPEQIRGQMVDGRTDVFALGIVIYELAVGRRPFGDSSSVDVVASILRETPVSVVAIRPELPGEFGEIVARCLEKDPSARFQTATEVRDALRHLKEAGAGSESDRAAASGVASIAVLPFVNRSREEADEY